jgi:hypothetical protein
MPFFDFNDLETVSRLMGDENRKEVSCEVSEDYDDNSQGRTRINQHTTDMPDQQITQLLKRTLVPTSHLPFFFLPQLLASFHHPPTPHLFFSAGTVQLLALFPFSGFLGSTWSLALWPVLV